jgi:hypothetical protein
MDCVVARAPRNDGETHIRILAARCGRGETIHGAARERRWIASSQGLLAMTLTQLRILAARGARRTNQIESLQQITRSC